MEIHDVYNQIEKEYKRFVELIKQNNESIDVINESSKLSLIINEIYNSTKENITQEERQKLGNFVNEKYREIDRLVREHTNLKRKEREKEKIDELFNLAFKNRLSFKRNVMLKESIDNNISEILKNNIEYFKQKFSNLKWAGKIILDQSNLYFGIEEKNSLEILNLYRFFDKNFILTESMVAYYYYHNSLNTSFNDFQGLLPEELKLFENYLKKEYIKQGKVLIGKEQTSFLEKLNNDELKEYLNKLKSDINSRNINRLLISNIKYFNNSDIEKELYEEIIKNIPNLYSDDLYDLIYNLGKENKSLLIENKEKIFEYLKNNFAKTNIDSISILNLLEENEIEGAKEFVGNNKTLLVRQITHNAKYNGEIDENYLESETYLIEKLIDELLEYQNIDFSHIKYLDKGLMFHVYQLGDYVLKLGKGKITHNCANSKDVLQPFIRNQFGDIYIEVAPLLQTRNLDPLEIEKIRQSLTEQKISYTDLGDNQFGRLEKPVKIPKMKNERLYPHQNEALDFSGQEVGNGYITEEMYEVGKYYVIDSDLLSQEETEYRTR